MNADLIASAGTSFGKNMLEATENMVDASGAGGPGMNWKAQSEAFEFMLEKAEDGLRFNADYADLCRDLFIANAKLEFFGAHASAQDRKRWSRLSADAYMELKLQERVVA